MNARSYVICDIEATGLEEDRDLIEIALITYSEGKITDIYETLINPLRVIPEYISNLTSITNRELKEAPKFYEVAEAIKSRLQGNIFVSHNTDFDLAMLKKKFSEMGEELNLKSFCTLKNAQHEIPGLKNYNLDALCSFFGIKVENRHRAIGDARAALDLFKELFSLQNKVYSKPLYLPQHAQSLKKITTKAGLIYFKNLDGKVFRIEATGNMLKRASELLSIRPENKELLVQTQMIDTEMTGSALIAEYKKLLFYPCKLNWFIGMTVLPTGEKRFKIAPFKKGLSGFWYFKTYPEAKKKLSFLIKSLKDKTFAYREGGKSKEEIIQQNQKFELLTKEGRFPSENLLIIGEGRILEEKSLIVVRGNHVLGYGYTTAKEDKIQADPDQYLTKKFHQNIGVDILTMNYLRVLKNQKHKTDGWRALAREPQL
jgi:DNA polymerase-3 subunit epsilon